VLILSVNLFKTYLSLLHPLDQPSRPVCQNRCGPILVSEIEFPLAIDEHEPDWHTSRSEMLEEGRRQHDERRRAREKK
jgi:hypothetical protein